MSLWSGDKWHVNISGNKVSGRQRSSFEKLVLSKTQLNFVKHRRPVEKEITLWKLSKIKQYSIYKYYWRHLLILNSKCVCDKQALTYKSNYFLFFKIDQIALIFVLICKSNRGILNQCCKSNCCAKNVGETGARGAKFL